jgi:hypothetical protein
VRILVANPNTSASVTDRIMQAARAAVSPGTELVPVTAAQGVPYIVTRAEAAIAAVASLELVAHHAAGCDAVVPESLDPDRMRHRTAVFADQFFGGFSALVQRRRGAERAWRPPGLDPLRGQRIP